MTDGPYIKIAITDISQYGENNAADCQIKISVEGEGEHKGALVNIAKLIEQQLALHYQSQVSSIVTHTDYMYLGDDTLADNNIA